MDGGSANQDDNDGENTGQSSGSVPQNINFDIAAFTVSFPTEPDELVSDNEDTEGQEKTTEEVCCLCLCSDRKLYTIPPQNRTTFQEVINKQINGEDGQGESLPPRVCWECNARMTSFTTFRTRAIQTNTLLYSLIRPFINVSEQSTIPEGSGVLATPRCVSHRHHASRTQPYNNLADENIPGRSRRLSFCVLQRPRRQPEGQED